MTSHRTPKAACVVLMALLFESAPAQEPASARKLVDRQFSQQLEMLAAKADELKLSDEAEQTRQWFIERDPRRQYLFLVREPADAGPSPDTLRGKWYTKFMQYRSAQADALFDLAKEELQNGRAATAFQLLHEALHEDPAHEQASKVLGKRPLTGRSFRRITGRTTDKQFGWLGREHWQVESPHFRIKTNVSPEAAEELAILLEDLHSVWQQVFFVHWSSPGALASRFAGRAVSLGRTPRHTVVLFRNRAEYVDELTPFEPNIGITHGYYLKDRRTAYLYSGDSSLQTIWIHEVVHQLFQETGYAVPDVGDRWNFWVVEAVALYFESLARHDGFYTVGGFDADRLQLARVRRFTGQFYMPTAELVTLGRQQLQNRPEIARIYTQAAGLAHFLMDANGGRFRQQFAKTIEAVYQHRDSVDALSVFLDQPFKKIDKLYADFLQVDDQDLFFLNPPPYVRQLYLARTRITDKEMARLAHLDQLNWLDVSHTRVGDDGVRRMESLPKLRRLDLQNTLVTDAAMQTVAAMPQLEELNLSGNAISDDGVAELAAATNLKVLLLNGTQVTNESLRLLNALESLRTVDVRGTRVTEQAWEAFRDKLPPPAETDSEQP